MAAMKLLLSQARRQGLTKPFPSPFQQIPRLFSSDSNEPRKKSVTIEPVSYAAKPKPESTNVESAASQEGRSSWTREEIRYVKDAASINPVSYAQRVAPLPEDRVAGEEEGERTPEEMERERKRIESENRARRRFLRANAVEEDTSSLPLPTLLKPELKHGKKPIFDLMEAIRDIKANAKAKFDETLEAHVRLGIEKGRSELIVRGTLALPHSVKKDVKVAFFAEGADAEDERPFTGKACRIEKDIKICWLCECIPLMQYDGKGLSSINTVAI